MTKKTINIGDILSARSGIIVHGCNAQGVMGSGLALQVKNQYPKAYQEYRAAFMRSGLKLGDVIFVDVTPDLIIANAITQLNYGRDPKIRYVNYKAVQDCFERIRYRALIRPSGIKASYPTDIHYPMIGAGLANGDWSIISEIIDVTFAGEPFINSNLWIQE